MRHDAIALLDLWGKWVGTRKFYAPECQITPFSKYIMGIYNPTKPGSPFLSADCSAINRVIMSWGENSTASKLLHIEHVNKLTEREKLNLAEMSKSTYHRRLESAQIKAYSGFNK